MNRFKCGSLDPLQATNYRQVGLVGFVGIVFFIASIIFALNPIRLLISGTETNGVVTEKREVEKFKNGKEVIEVSSAIKYTDTSNGEHKFWIRGEFPNGTTIPVVYLADEPEVAAKVGDKSGFGGPALPFIIGLALLTWSFWFTGRLLKKRKVIKDLMTRVTPLSAKVISVPSEVHTSKSGLHHRSYRTYRVIAQVNVNGNSAQEFESYNYVGYPSIEAGTEIKLYVDPLNPALYYLSASP